MTAQLHTITEVEPDALAETVAAGGQFCSLVATADRGGDIRLRAVLARPGGLDIVGTVLASGQDHYRALTPLVPSAYWYEREVHDLFGLVPDGHPRLDALVFPLPKIQGGPIRPGTRERTDRLDPDPSSLPGHVTGEGVFTIPYGPVRSGIFETVEYLVETFGEDIPQVRVRPYLKHRGMARRFTGMTVDDAVLLAERVEGTMSVAHAMAFSQAVEKLSDVQPPPGALLQRVVHAELERVANHLDSMIRHAEGAGQAVAYARLTFHRERVLRLQAALCGHRFARGVVVPGGTRGPPQQAIDEARATLKGIEVDLARDVSTLMLTPSFLDRLRATGVLTVDVATRHGARGPVGRASGTGDDARSERPYGAYHGMGFTPAPKRHDGDALSRQWVRDDELASSLELAGQALDQLAAHLGGPWRVPVPPVTGTAAASVESPQGELVYLVDLKGRQIGSVKPCTASFHNFALFSQAFGGDIFTDFVFIEASFGVNLAGVAG